MPYKIQVHTPRQIALFRFDGAVTVKEAKQAFLDYVEMPDFNPDFVMLSDARTVTQIDAAFTQILSNLFGLSRPLSKFSSGALSVVMVSDDTVFGSARMLEQALDYISKIKLRICVTEASAMQMCGQSGQSFDALWQETYVP